MPHPRAALRGSFAARAIPRRVSLLPKLANPTVLFLLQQNDRACFPQSSINKDESCVSSNLPDLALVVYYLDRIGTAGRFEGHSI